MLRCRQRASQNLTVALAPDDFKPASELGPGDFLVRGLAGFDPRAGVLLVGGGARLVSTLSNPPRIACCVTGFTMRACSWSERGEHPKNLGWQVVWLAAERPRAKGTMQDMFQGPAQPFASLLCIEAGHTPLDLI